jgi:translation initiation factor 2B subunit (eIF-2B alpha/beta/delta family)
MDKSQNHINQSKQSEQIKQMVEPIRDDLLSGAAEIALRAISIFQNVLTTSQSLSATELKEQLQFTADALIEAQPAMASVFHLCNTVLLTSSAAKQADDKKQSDQIRLDCAEALEKFEKMLCDSAAEIAEKAIALIPPGELIFAYSFSSTVVSMLLHARAKGRYFRVACTESRPSMEGRKLATRLAAGGIEVICTFDSAMGLVLPNCSTAFMGCDCLGRPGVVNKVGSYVLALTCKELKIPLYALAGTEKIVSDDRLFEFEKHERPGDEVWENPPHGVQVLNRQFELVPLSLITGIVTENGVLHENEINGYVAKTEIHESLRLEAVAF